MKKASLNSAALFNEVKGNANALQVKSITDVMQVKSNASIAGKSIAHDAGK